MDHSTNSGRTENSLKNICQEISGHQDESTQKDGQACGRDTNTTSDCVDMPIHGTAATWEQVGTEETDRIPGTIALQEGAGGN